MKLIRFAFALLVGLTGCECVKRQIVECCGVPYPCRTVRSAPHPCEVVMDDPAERPARPAHCPAPQVDVQAAEEVVVHAPRQKVVVEAPAPCQAPAAPAPCQAPAPAPCQAPAQAMAPAPCQQAPAPEYAHGPTITTKVKQKTRMGFMFDTIRLPIPILRPVAMPQPAEMTMTMPAAPAAAMMPMMPMAAPMMPMAAPMMPMTASMGMPMAAPGMTMMPQPAIGMAQLNMQGQMSLQQLLMLLTQGGSSPQLLQALLQVSAGGNGTAAQSLSLTQLQQVLAALQAAQGGTAGAASAAPAAAAPAPTTPPPATPAPAAPGGTTGTPMPIGTPQASSGAAVSLVSATATPPATAAATGGAPSAAVLQEKLRLAEQRLKALEDLRSGTAK